MDITKSNDQFHAKMNDCNRVTNFSIPCQGLKLQQVADLRERTTINQKFNAPF